MAEEIFCKSISCVHKSMNMVMTQSYGNIFVNRLFLCKSLLIDSWRECRVLITVEFC